MGPFEAIVALAVPKKMRLPTVAPGTLMGLMLVISALTTDRGLLIGLIYYKSYYAVAINTWVVAAMTGGSECFAQIGKWVTIYAVCFGASHPCDDSPGRDRLCQIGPDCLCC